MIWTVHILSLLFALFCARHDVPAINNFEFYGSTPSEQGLFHGANWKLKFVFCLLVGSIPFLHGAGLINSFLYFTVAALNIWTVFDPIVARTRARKKVWYYLSKGNQTDRILLSLFGSKAGIYKTLICIAINSIITYLL